MCYSNHLRRPIIMITNLVNVEKNVIMVENDTGARVVLQNYTRLRSIVDSEINGSFATPENNAKLAATGQKRLWRQLMPNGILAAFAAWRMHNATTAELPIKLEAVYGRL